jgi:hypothetical protein
MSVCQNNFFKIRFLTVFIIAQQLLLLVSERKERGGEFREKKTRGRILGRNLDNSLRGFPPSYSQSPPSSPSKSSLKLVCNNVYGKLKSDNSQDFAQKPERNFTFMSSASGLGLTTTLHRHPNRWGEGRHGLRRMARTKKNIAFLFFPGEAVSKEILKWSLESS